MDRSNTNFEDVQAFHDKMGLSDVRMPEPGFPPTDFLQFRAKFMAEELKEFTDELGVHETQIQLHIDGQVTYLTTEQLARLEKMGDALIDLVYVALGTADAMGLPWQKMWDEVQRANMAKELAQSAEHSLASTGRGHAKDVIKPKGWTPPDHIPILLDAGWRAQNW